MSAKEKPEKGNVDLSGLEEKGKEVWASGKDFVGELFHVGKDVWDRIKKTGVFEKLSGHVDKIKTKIEERLPDEVKNKISAVSNKVKRVVKEAENLRKKDGNGTSKKK